ncbi:MAG: hypothetical protein KDB07_05345, partial [Planctomycetes bacterium]|nr:hypothetical protein [Planctomycetota bacterium]
RAAAVEALGAGSLNSDLGERTTEWAMAQIGGETSPLVQVQLVKVLAHALPTLRDGRVKDTLKSLYRTNPHIEVRKEIIRILGEEALR